MTTAELISEEDAALLIQRSYRRWKRSCNSRVACPASDGVATVNDTPSSEAETPSAICWERKALPSQDKMRKEEECDSQHEGHRETVDKIMRMLQDSEVQNAKAMTLVQSAGIFGGENNGRTTSASKQAENVLHKFRKKVDELKQGMREKDTTIEKLKQEMEHQNQINKMEIQNAVQIERARYEQQQRIHDLDLEKRLKFIDSLLQDKEKWVKQSEQLSNDIKNLQSSHESQIKELKERLAAEIRKQKSEWTQKENAKRSKWMKEQREEILDSTAKVHLPFSVVRVAYNALQAMEPKIAEMTHQHKAEIRRMREKIEAQERLLAQNEEHSMQLRQRLIQEKEECIEKERLRSHSQFMHEKDKLKIQSESEKDYLRSQWTDDRNKLTKELEQMKIHLETSLLDEQTTRERAIDELKQEHSQEKEELQLAHCKDIENQRVACEAEKEGWKEALRTELHQQMLHELQKTKSQLEKERDEELEVVMQRFEEEKANMESELRTRIVQLQHQKEKQIDIVNEKNMDLNKQSTEMLHLREEIEDQAIKMNEQLDAKELEIREYKDINAALRKQTETLKLQISNEREEHQEALQKREQTIETQLRQETQTRESLESAARTSQKAIEDLKQHHQEELEALENRVKEALQLKDAFIDGLQQRLSIKAAELHAMNQLLRDQTQRLDDT